MTITTSDGDQLTATVDHPIYETTTASWVDAGELSPGDMLDPLEGADVAVTSVRYETTLAVVYNLTVETVHTYHAGNNELLVHNCRSSNEGIYEFESSDGTIYVGQSGNIPNRIDAHVQSGKLKRDKLDTVERTPVSGGKTSREIAEQRRIDGLGGIEDLRNLRNPIGAARKHLME